MRVLQGPADQAAVEAMAANVARRGPATAASGSCPPWAADQRLAAAAALMALGAT